MLNLALELNYINKEVSDNLKKTSLEISKMLSGLIKTL
jgi:four helix bundle protein